MTDAMQQAAPTREPAQTGHPAVDEVLAALRGLEARPVSEHVALFEGAHEALRRALEDASESGSEPGDRPAPSGPG